MTGCPKTTQIHKIIPIMLDYHWHKYDPDKMFNMDCRRGAPYPYYNMDRVNDTNFDVSDDKSKQFKEHNFDIYKNKNKKCSKFNPTIGGINATQRGKQTVHGDNYKYDASKLSATQILSLPENIEIPNC